MKNFQDDFSPDSIEDMFACLNVAKESGNMLYAIKAIQSAINLGPCFTAIDVICVLRYFDNKDGRKDIRRHTNTILAIAAMLADKKPETDELDLSEDTELKNLDTEIQEKIPTNIASHYQEFMTRVFEDTCIGGKGEPTGNEEWYKSTMLTMGNALIESYPK